MSTLKRPSVLWIAIAACGQGVAVQAQSVPTAVVSIAALPHGVMGNTLCINADGPEGEPTYERLERVLGRGAVEAPSDGVYSPTRAHVVERTGDAWVGAYFGFLAISPTDVNLDGVSWANGGDRSRTEIKIAPEPGVADAFKAHEGHTLVYRWRFQLDSRMKYSTNFTHLHQIKAKGGAYDEPPLITFTVTSNGRLAVRHVAGDVKASDGYTVLGDMAIGDVLDQWLDVRQEIEFSRSGTYKLDITDRAGKSVLTINRSNLNNWRAGADHFRPKWGIYRKHQPALNQHQDDWFYIANIAITRGLEKADSLCRPEP